MISNISIKKNYVYSSLLTIAGYLFPLITFPYISRVLGVNNIGICGFVDSIINYYILFSMMGVTTLGIREIAKNKTDRNRLSESFTNILFLNLISTIVMLIILFISINVVPKFSEYKELLYIGSAKLLFNCFLIEWFYKGIENFKYITIRTIVVKFIYVVGVFLFIHKPDDYNIYYILTTLTIVLNAIINSIYCKQFIDLSWKKVNLNKYCKQYLILGIYGILTSMYTTFNVLYLGFICTDIEVGYYTTSVRLQTLILALFTALTNVLMPRMSFLFSQHKINEFIDLYKKTINVLYVFSFPLIIYTIVYASQIIQLLAGDGYEKSSICLQIIVSNILIIGLEQILIVQVLMPMSKDKSIFINSIVGAFFGILLDVFLINNYGSIGAAISWVFAELIVCILAIYFTKKYLSIKFDYKLFFKYIIYSFPICLILILFSLIEINYILSMSIGIIILLLYYYIIYVYVLKLDFIIELINKKNGCINNNSQL